MGDSIDCIANVYTRHCFDCIGIYGHVLHILESKDTVAAALTYLKSNGLVRFVDVERPQVGVRSEIGRYSRCIERMGEVKCVSRRVLAFHSVECGAFHQEACFSYVCKFLMAMGPSLEHFANRPSKADIVEAELWLAIHTPLLILEEPLHCFEMMPSKEDLVGFGQANSAVTSKRKGCDLGAATAGTSQYALVTAPDVTMAHER